MSNAYEVYYELQSPLGGWLKRQCVVWCNSEEEIEDSLKDSLQPCIVVDDQLIELSDQPSIQNITILSQWESVNSTIESIQPFSTTLSTLTEPEAMDTLYTEDTLSEPHFHFDLPEE